MTERSQFLPPQPFMSQPRAYGEPGPPKGRNVAEDIYKGLGRRFFQEGPVGRDSGQMLECQASGPLG